MRSWVRAGSGAAAEGGWLSPRARLAIGLILMMVAWTFLLAADGGLQIRYFRDGATPMRFVQIDPLVRADLHARLHEDESLAVDDDEHVRAPLPGVVVVHGYAGSSTLMLGYARVLARAGYGVMLVDLPGHGANVRPLEPGAVEDALREARATLAGQPEVDPERIALLGHSMGAGAVLEAGVRQPGDVSAVIAISPVGAPVTPSAPRNLQLQAGGWEPAFVERARRLLEQAGGAGDAFAQGLARALVVVPRADHLGILFRGASHDAARSWLDSVFGADPMAQPATDRRMLWWLIHLAGAMLFVSSMAPGDARKPTFQPREGPWSQWLAFVLAPFVATLLCWLLSRVMDLGNLGSVAVAPALALWFAVAGAVLLFVPFRFVRFEATHGLRGLLAFAFLWMAVGATAGLVWLDWGIEGPRLLLWPLAALAAIPWFTAMEGLRHGARGGARLLWWLGESALLMAALWLAAVLIPGLGVVMLLLPLVPLFLGVLTVVSSRVNDPLAAGIGCGLFWGWLLVVAFPIVG